MSFYESTNANNGGGGFFSPSGSNNNNNNNMSSPGFQGTPKAFGSQTKRSNSRKDRETLVPVTIKMIQDAEQDTNDDSVFRLSGAQEFSQVKVVGSVVSVKEQSTNVLYVVEDGTGRMDVKMWLDTDQDDVMDGGDGTSSSAAAANKCTEGTYVRAIGTVKVFNDKRHVSAFNIRPVEDFNEITHHALETAYVHLKATKGAQTGAVTENDAATKTYEGPVDASGNAGDKLQNDVVRVFTENSSMDDQGLDIRKAIEMLLPKGYSAPEIRKAIGFLTDEGHLYSTIDENHLKSTEAC